MEIIEDILRKHLNLNAERYAFQYTQNTSPDAIEPNDAWLKSNSSWIYQVGVLTAIDNNKCDFLQIAIGTKRSPTDSVNIIGVLHFRGGENDDVARVLDRAMKMLPSHHPVFELD